jgi:hypothetical protein
MCTQAQVWRLIGFVGCCLYQQLVAIGRYRGDEPCPGMLRWKSVRSLTNAVSVVLLLQPAVSPCPVVWCNHSMSSNIAWHVVL